MMDIWETITAVSAAACVFAFWAWTIWVDYKRNRDKQEIWRLVRMEIEEQVASAVFASQQRRKLLKVGRNYSIWTKGRKQ